MAKKVLLKDQNEELLPITRGELVLDSSGQQALHSAQFLATDSQPGLMAASQTYSPASISLKKEWLPSGFILSEDNGFTTGLYAIKITSGSLIFSGMVSIYVGAINVEDEIVLHMSGIQQQFTDGVQGRIYAKIALSQTDTDYGELYLATSVPQSAITNLSITLKKLL